MFSSGLIANVFLNSMGEVDKITYDKVSIEFFYLKNLFDHVVGLSQGLSLWPGLYYLKMIKTSSGSCLFRPTFRFLNPIPWRKKLFTTL
jgi:hypothetical protein